MQEEVKARRARSTLGRCSLKTPILQQPWGTNILQKGTSFSREFFLPMDEISK